MTASFDIATLAICLGLVNLMQFVAFIVQYRIDPSRPGPGFWATASAIGCAGLAANFLRDLPGLEELKGAGLLSGRIPPGFRMPLPPADDELAEDEDPMTASDIEELGLLTPGGSDEE